MSVFSSRKSFVTRQVTGARSANHSRYAGASMGLRPLGLHSLIQEIRAGFDFKSLERLSAASGLGVSEIAALIDVPDRTLARRKAAGRFTTQESERLLRISRVFEMAVDLFEGNTKAAVMWLKRPNHALGNQPPLSFQSTEIGARLVEDLIGGLEEGVVV
jgi:putative toxin-antitoxin system antitoxin component (TIGR02293 family)